MERKQSRASGTSDFEDLEAMEINDSSKYSSSKKWEWSYLRKECSNLGLDPFYKLYIFRMQRSFLTILIVIQAVVTISHITILLTGKKDASIAPDIFVYAFSTMIMTIVLLPAFRCHVTNEWLPFVCSSLALFVIVFSDLSIPIYHAVVNLTRPPLRPMYASHVLSIIYIFLPIPDNLIVTLLGLATSISYAIVMVFVSYALDEHIIIKVLSEVVFLTCINFMGIFFRLTNEVDIRRTFLDRRDCVQRNLSLRYERKQEKELLLSILPEHIAEKMEKDIQNMIKKLKNKKRSNSTSYLDPRNLELSYKNPQSKRQWSATNKLYVEKHTDVSILYADVVNYTQMTTQLPVRTLVETLHSLFVKFDEASVEFNVLRIKFLGDCYYCVSGVPIKNKRHAKNCVDLGLRMIKDIRDVRKERNLNIDMRIGVHSGTVIGGVMGACKWQYDIWSRDVIIANTLESTGVAGKVHITGQALELLDGEYFYEEGTQKAKLDQLLIKNNIKTYLISPKGLINDDIASSSRAPINGRYKRPTLKAMQSHTESHSTRKNFMQNSMEQFREIMKQTNIEMEQELERMPIGKFQLHKLFSSRKRQQEPTRRTGQQHEMYDEFEETNYQNRRMNKVSRVFLTFENKKWEWKFLNEPDLMLKYSVLMSCVVLITIFGIQVLNRSNESLFFWYTGLSTVLMFSFVPLVWFKKVWDFFTPTLETNSTKTRPPKNKIIRMLYELSYDIMGNAILRTIIYLIIVLILCTVSLLHLMECREEYANGKDPFEKLNTSYSSYNDLSQLDYSSCLNSWSVTQSLVLAICTSFLFLRIHFMLKLLMAVLVDGVYFYVINHAVNFIYDVSASVNPAMYAKTAHFLKVMVATIIFHLIDRQSEYIQRVGFIWKQHLLERKEIAEVTKETNNILVHNILPVHVAELYLNRQLRNELYSEEYDNCSVMFATVTNFDKTTDSLESEQNVLKTLNEIICAFDEKLLTFNGYQKIEKIKVAGWTYMVACGLDPGRGDSTSSYNNGMLDGRRSLNMSVYTQSSHRKSREIPARRPKISLRQSNNVVIVLAEFALELMKVLKKFSDKSFADSDPLQLRVGISHGKVMAGVVGSSKPLYDIWGNAVNMASRMDSTGIGGAIQVTEDTANILLSFGFKCDYRGETIVKGKGQIPTYFLLINDELEFIKDITIKTNLNSFETKL